VFAPGPFDRPLQYIDSRDLGAWMLGCAAGDVSVAFNAVSRSGHATMGDLLRCCTDLFAWHGYSVILVDGVWRKASYAGLKASLTSQAIPSEAPLRVTTWFGKLKTGGGLNAESKALCAKSALKAIR
jgi:hypothetical protein